MKVKITNGRFWYTDKVGEVIEVKDRVRESAWRVLEGSEKHFPIFKSDGEIVKDGR
jgi:hypothetical protein